MLDWIYNNLGSISQIILYITIFSIIYFKIYFKQHKDEMIKNWNKYRFKPYILPFAGFIYNDGDGSNTSSITSSIKNFSMVIWNSLNTFFNILIKPIQFILLIIRKQIGEIGNVVEVFRKQLKIMRNFLMAIVMKMMKRIENIISATIFTFGKINDITKRQLGIYQNLIYMMETFAVTLTTFISGSFSNLIDFSEGALWTLPVFTLGIPGLAFPIMTMCFTPNTLILVPNGRKLISDIRLGETLADGSKVVSVMQFLNAGGSPIFEYNNDYVSGTHFVEENGIWIRVGDSRNAKPFVYNGMLYNINTSSNKLQSSNNLYLDYDEYCSRELSEKENRHFLEKLNGKAYVDALGEHPIKLNDRVRYKIGVSQEAKINDILIKDLQIGTKINSGKKTVLGLVVHECNLNDRIFRLNGVNMTEWVKVQYKKNWVCVRDHPAAEPSSNFKSGKLYSIITSDHTIQLDNGCIIRDFLEYSN